MIINVERTRPVLARAADLVVTIIAWILFIILLYRGVLDAGTKPQSGPRPLVPDLLSTFDTLTLYLLIALINAMILVGWALYNQFRFRGRDRREPIGALPDRKLARGFRVKEDVLKELRSTRSVVVFHDEEGNFAGMQHRTISSK